MTTTLITGASSGFGEATARLLAQKGHKLILVARRKDRLEKLANELKVPCYCAKVDVSKREEVEQFFKNVPNEFKPIDVLINNAGLALENQPADQAKMENWIPMIETNVNGLLYFTEGVLPEMVKRNHGHIINIGSMSGHVPYKGSNVYGATKAFVLQFSRNLRVDLFGTNVRVTTIEPGVAETEFSLVRFNEDEKRAHAVYEGYIPLKPMDIAEAIVWSIERPAHVNIENIEIMPVDQIWGGYSINRKNGNK